VRSVARESRQTRGEGRRRGLRAAVAAAAVAVAAAEVAVVAAAYVAIAVAVAAAAIVIATAAAASAATAAADAAAVDAAAAVDGWRRSKGRISNSNRTVRAKGWRWNMWQVGERWGDVMRGVKGRGEGREGGRTRSGNRSKSMRDGRSGGKGSQRNGGILKESNVLYDVRETRSRAKPLAEELQVIEEGHPVKLVIPTILLLLRVTRLIYVHRDLARVLWKGVKGGIVPIILKPDDPESCRSTKDAWKPLRRQSLRKLVR
jgi:hypothetical protein